MLRATGWRECTDLCGVTPRTVVALQTARRVERLRDVAELGAHRDAAIDRGEQARFEIGAIKVVGARMLHNVVDRAIQCYGAAGLTDDTPLSFMYRAARFGRIYDGPDEVHIHTVARRILKQFRDGVGWDFSGPLS